MFGVFEKSIFDFLANFWLTKLNRCFGKVRQRLENSLNQNLVIGRFLENGFEDTLNSKANVWSFENTIFQFFVSFWVTKVKPFFGKVKGSVQNYLNQNLVLGNFFENGFEVTLRSKTNLLSVYKEHFSLFCYIWVTKLELFFGKVRQSVQNYLNQNLVVGSFVQNGFEATFSSKTNLLQIFLWGS